MVSTDYRIHAIEPDAPVFVLSPRKTKSPGELPLVSDAQQSGVEEPKTWITSERTRATITAWSVSTSAYLRPTTHRSPSPAKRNMASGTGNVLHHNLSLLHHVWSLLPIQHYRNLRLTSPSDVHVSATWQCSGSCHCKTSHSGHTYIENHQHEVVGDQSGRDM